MILDTDTLKATLVEQGQAIQILLETADPNRVQRAGSLTVSHVQEDPKVGTRALVHSTTFQYNVTLSKIREGRIRQYTCNCPDFNHTPKVCKHIAALLNHTIQQKRQAYRDILALERRFGG